MNRYLLFAGASYYAGGGWIDFILDYHDKEDAIKEGERLSKGMWVGDNKIDWFHVIDIQTGDIEEKVDGSYCGRGLND